MRKSISALFVCFSASLFFFYVIFQMTVFNTISDQLISAYHITTTQFGMLSSAYFYAATIFLIPAGLGLDNFSTRKQLLSVMFLCVLGTFIFSLSSSLLAIIFYRAVCGVGNTFAFLGCMRLAPQWLPPRRCALVMGFMITIGMLGGIMQTPFTFLVTTLGWQHAMLVDAFIGLIFLLIMFFGIQDKVTEKPNTKVNFGLSKLFSGLKVSIANTQNWSCSIYTSLLNLPVMLLAAAWGNLYLAQARDLSETKATLVTSMIFLGLIFGSPFMGWLSDNLKSRRRPMIFGALLTLLVSLVVIYIPQPSLKELMLLFFLLGFLCSAQVISYPTVAESNASNVASTAMSIVSMLIYLVGAIIQPIFGWLITLSGHQQMINNKVVYPAHSYQVALLVMPAAFVISFLIAFVVKETYANSVRAPVDESAILISGK